MAYEESLKSVSFDADATVALYTGVPGMVGSADPNIGHQYEFVKITGRHQIGLAGAGDAAVGVLQNKPQVTGQAATVAIFGITPVRSGAAIAVGDLVEADSAGRAITATTGAALGTAIEAATGADQLISVLLK
jgi:hypothetical protein